MLSQTKQSKNRKNYSIGILRNSWAIMLMNKIRWIRSPLRIPSNQFTISTEKSSMSCSRNYWAWRPSNHLLSISTNLASTATFKKCCFTFRWFTRLFSYGSASAMTFSSMWRNCLMAKKTRKMQKTSKRQTSKSMRTKSREPTWFILSLPTHSWQSAFWY